MTKNGLVSNLNIILNAVLVAASFASVAGASPVSVKIEEIDLSGPNPSLILPIRSETFFENKLPGFTPGDIDSTTQADYSLRCSRESLAAARYSLYPIRDSDIPEMARPSLASDKPMILSATCSDATNASIKSFHHVEGQLTLQFRKLPIAFENADRRLYHLTLPLKFSGGWDSVDAAKQRYRETCERLQGSIGQNHSSVLYVHCMEPTVEIKCCGVADLTTEVHVVVFAYANPKLESITNTHKTFLGVEAQNAKYLSDESDVNGPDLAFAFCTPANFEYSPVMANQSQCFALKQTYVARRPDLIRCHGDATVEGLAATLWASHKKSGSDDLLRVAIKTSRYSGEEVVQAALHATATGSQLKSSDGVIVLSIQGSDGILQGVQTKFKGAPAQIQMKCDKF